MTHYHPDQFLLNDYVAGSLPGAVALPIAVHLEYCPQCREEVAQLSRLGAELFNELDPVPVGDDAFARLLDRLDGKGAVPVASVAPKRPARARDGLPRALRSLAPEGVEELDWKRISGSLRASRLGFGDPQREVALHHIRAGGKVLAHGHAGSEITVVLNGSFSDQDGRYAQGDFLVRGSGRRAPTRWPPRTPTACAWRCWTPRSASADCSDAWRIPSCVSIRAEREAR